MAPRRRVDRTAGWTWPMATVALLAATFSSDSPSAPLPGAAAQHDMTTNLTGLAGTWSSGSGNVMTGAGFVNPVNFSFNYPTTSGIAMSFTDDGFWEEAQYRYISNGTQPDCVKAVIFWQHGSYTLQPNGSITMAPISADGRIQVQDPCAAQSSVLTYYNQPSLYQSWQIYNDVNHNTFMLQLQAYDGSLFPRLYLVARPPSMLPTVQLTTNKTEQDTSAVNQQAAGSNHRRSFTKRALDNAHSGPTGLWKRWVEKWRVD